MHMRLLPLVFLLFINITIAQELPEIVPPSPQAFEMTKYGNIPINESTGMVNASIPLYTYKAGNIQLPIALNYSGSGVKVNALSTWTGINWTLNAGGVITRTVKDQPDESHDPTKRLLYGQAELDALNLDPYNEDDIDFLRAVATQAPIYDTQADIFSFNFAGYSGSFYLDENLEAKLTNYENELKIRFLENLPLNPSYTDPTIVITDPNGTKYYFGGPNGVEQSNFNNGGASTSSTYDTAYYLYEIRSATLVDVISLEYETVEQYSIYWGRNQSETKLRNSLYHVIGQFCVSTPPLSSSSTNSQSTQHVFNGRFLSKISNNRTSEELRFDSETFENNFHFTGKLNGIDVYYNNIRKQYFDLDYHMYSTRFFLKDVTFHGISSGTPSYSYSLEYNDASGLPARDSYAQDYLGYYNGKPNTSLLPRGVEEFSGYGYADRNPDFGYSSKGTLTKITYPTGGSTEFEYEAPLLYKYPDVGKSMQAYLNQDNYLPGTDLTDFVYLSYPNPLPPGEGDGNPIHEIGATQDITVNIDITAENVFPYKNIDIIVTLYSFLNGNPGVIASEKFDFYDSSGNPTTSQTKTTTFYNVPGNMGYKVGIEIIPDTVNPFADVDNLKIKANASFDITASEELPYEQVGIRVRRTIDKPLEGTPITKRYIYKAMDQLDENEYAKSINEQAYLKLFYEQGCCVPAGPGSLVTGYNLYAYATLSANPLGNFLNNDFIFYPVVTTSYGDDNFIYGGTEKTFLYSQALSQSPYSDFNLNIEGGRFYENNNMFNGKLLKEIGIKQKNNLAYIDTKTTYDYLLDNVDFASSWIITKSINCDEFNRPIVLENEFYNYINMGLVKTYTSKLQLNSKISRTFHEDIPIEDKSLLDIETDTYASINTIETYEYDSYPNQPTKVTVTTSNDDTVLETKNYYVDMVGQLSGLTQDQIDAYNLLETKNIVGAPIQSETYQKKGTNPSELLTKQRTLYKNWNGGVLVLPQFIQTAKGSQSLENRIAFIDYSYYGDLIEVSKSDGAKIRYMYSSLSQPIRKIENYDDSISVPHFGTNASSPPSCYYQDQHPNSLVTLYSYKDGTNLLESIEDPKCRKTTFEYDDFYRLEEVKDADGNILNKNKYNYKR